MAYQAIQDFGKYKVGDIVPEKDIIEGYVVRVADEPKTKSEAITYPAQLTNSNPA